jgi:hypothetical protein
MPPIKKSTVTSKPAGSTSTQGTRTSGTRNTAKAALNAANPVNIAKRIVPNRSTPIHHLMFYATVGGLALVEIVEPPIAAVIVVGHLLHGSRNRAVAESGEGLENA